VADVPGEPGVGFGTFCRMGRREGGAGGIEIEVSRDGSSAYVLGNEGRGSVQHLRRDRETGRLSYAGCIGLAEGCTDLRRAITPVESATRGLILLTTRLSPDGRSLYVGAARTYQPPGGSDVYIPVIIRLTRQANGDLSYAGCMNIAGCGDGTALPGEGVVQDLDVSANGRSVYASFRTPTSDPSLVVAHLRRSPSGSLSPAGCVGGAASCAPWRAVAGGSGALAVSADGSSVYVVGESRVLHLRRAPANGDLFPAGCLGTAAGCRPTPAGTLEDAGRITVSADGSSVYVKTPHGITHLRRELAPGQVIPPPVLPPDASSLPPGGLGMSLDCPDNPDRGDDESVSGSITPPKAGVPVQLRIGKPGDDELDPVVYTDAAGLFWFKLDTDRAGDWTIHATVLGSPAAAECDFDVSGGDGDRDRGGKGGGGKGGKPPT
jgi:hypothetical protein